MPDKRIPDVDPQDCFTEEQIDNAVLGYLLYGPSWPWSIDELGRELGHESNAIDAVRRLTRTGLVHRVTSSSSRPARPAEPMSYGSAPSERLVVGATPASWLGVALSPLGIRRGLVRGAKAWGAGMASRSGGSATRP